MHGKWLQNGLAFDQKDGSTSKLVSQQSLPPLEPAIASAQYSTLPHFEVIFKCLKAEGKGNEMSSEHEEKHLHIHLSPGLMQSAYCLFPYILWFQGRTAETNENPDRWRNLQAFQRKRKKEKAFLEDISGNASECWAIKFMLPLHNLLLTQENKILETKLCTKKYITIKK